MVTALLIIHGLVGGRAARRNYPPDIATWVTWRAQGPVRSSVAFVPCRSASFANAIVVLYSVAATLGAVVYLYFRVDIRPALEQAGRWQALGFFEIKEHFVAIGLALLPAYWVCWRQPRDDESDTNARRPDLDSRLHRLVGLSSSVT